MFKGSRGSLREFARETRGNVAILFGVALIPLMIGIGVAVDYGRALIVRERLQDAIDSAGLAAGSWVGLSPAEMKVKAQKYFEANYPPSSIGTLSALNVSSAGNTVEITASADVPTTIMRLANFQTIGVSAKSTVAIGMGTLEVALALDNSGSMAGTKISSLRTAATDLVDILFSSGQYSPKPEPIKISVVPFAASVNVGSQNANANWMDKNGIGKYHAYEMKCYANGGTLNNSGVCSVNVGTAINNFTLFNSLKTSGGAAVTWGGCVEARSDPHDVTDAAPSAAATVFVPMFAPDEPDNWNCTTSTCSNACVASSAGGNCSSSSTGLVYSGTRTGNHSFNNYLPDGGDTATGCSTFTVSIGSQATITKASHGFVAGDQVIFTTTGSLPNGLNKNTRYYVISSGLTQNSFRVSTSSNGSAVNTSGNQSGTHSIANSWTCSSGSAQCARSGNSGNTSSTSTPVGQSEQNAFGGKAIPNNPNCKYGTPNNKAAVTNMTVGNIPGGPNFMCTTTPLLPLSMDQAAVKNAINAMAAEGATSIMEGAMWGWRTLSPGEPFTEGRAYGTEENQKVLVLMSDGQNTYYPNSKFVKSWYEVYGYVARNGLGTTSTNSSTLTQAMNNRTKLACDNIKAAKIIIYAVAFQIPGDQASALDLLEYCASDPDKYFAPNTEADLVASFNAIGKDISMLRIAE